MKRIMIIVIMLPALATAGAGLLVAASLEMTSRWQDRAQPAVGAAGGPPLATIPDSMLHLYSSAASSCPGLPWTLLAAIGTVESGNGTSGLPGVHSGQNRAGAEGPMQFEPGTFAKYAEPVPPGGAVPPSPYDPVDAVYAATRMLCADGAADPSRVGRALFDYNHSSAYVASVLALAGQLRLQWGDDALGRAAVQYALAQVGSPYRWGGETPGVGFDCSGLAQAAWAAAGRVIPRVAQAQFEAGPAVPPGRALAPGDLVFFGPAPGDATHVGVVVDPQGTMVDAPHTGAAVRVESFPVEVGAAWGADVYLGATSPGT